MALKCFKLAREDYRYLVQTHPHSKNTNYLNRLARCNLALGSHDAARDVLHRVLEIEPENPDAIYLLAEAARLQVKLANLDREIKSNHWNATLKLVDECIHSIEAKGAEVPYQWRVWRIEAEIKRGNWEGADTESRCVDHSHHPLPILIDLKFLSIF
jgi:DnaJ family protein C protein 7